MAPVFSGRCLTLCGVVNSKYVVMIVINNDTVQLFTSYFICCVYLRFSWRADKMFAEQAGDQEG